MATVEGDDSDVFVQMHDSGEKLRLSVAVMGMECAKVLDATDVSLLLKELGRHRAEMLPPISKKLDPSPVFRDVTRETTFHVDRPNVVSKEFFIAVLHPGFGWLAFPMNEQTGTALAALIMRQVDAMKPKIIKPDGLM